MKSTNPNYPATVREDRRYLALSQEDPDGEHFTQREVIFMVSNPTFGVTWSGKDGYETKARKLKKTRYRPGRDGNPHVEGKPVMSLRYRSQYGI
jgi:hypothetical protein